MPCKASAALLGALLLSGCNQSSGRSAASAAAHNDCVFVRCNQDSGGANAVSVPAQPSASEKQVATALAQQIARAASSTNWVDTAQTPDGSNYSIDPASYQILDDHRVRIAEKITGKASSPDAATIYLDDYDCSEHSQTATMYVRLNESGKIVGLHRFQESERPATALSPGMVGWAISQSICKTLGMNS